MPQLLLFVPCEKVITSSEGPLTLVSVLEKIVTSVPEGPPLPANTVALPMRWNTVTVWMREESDAAHSEYEQQIRAVDQQGDVLFHTDPTELTFSGGLQLHRIITSNPIFPLMEGRVTLELSLRRIGETTWNTVTTYPIFAEVVRD